MWRWKRFFAKASSFLHRDRADAELAREIASHLALMEDEFQSRGMSAEEARLAALRAYGGVEQAKELHREERSFAGLEQALQDIRHAWRGLLRSPSYSMVALISFALGIGVNAAIFTLVNGILLKRLPVPEPNRIVQIQGRIGDFETSAFSFPAFREFRSKDAMFEDVIGFASRPTVLDFEGDPRKVDVQMVTGSYFAFFGARPALGRLLDEEDDRTEGANRVCVLSYEAWRLLFGGDPGALNRTIRLKGVPVRIVGVASAGFHGADMQRRFDLWVPTSMSSDFDGGSRDSAGRIWISVLARLRRDVSFDEARQRILAASPAIEDALPASRANAGATYQILDASKGFDSWRSSLRDPLLILMGAVSLVLLLACANLANLFLARANERQREFSVKLALGISRGRLVRQLLVEVFVLSFAGGAVAILLSIALTRVLLDLFNAGNRYGALHVAPDSTVLLFTLATCTLTAVIAGVYPAWKASVTDASVGFRGESPFGARHGQARRALIVVQVTLAIVLVFAASLFAHSLRNLKTIDLGYDIDRVLTLAIEQRGAGHHSPALGNVLARVRQLPGVESAAFSSPGVLSGATMGTSFDVEDGSGNLKRVNVSILFAGAGYMSTLRIPVIRGRDFTGADHTQAPPVVIVNRRFAEKAWPGQDPTGKYILWGSRRVEVIGVAGNSKYESVREKTRMLAYPAFDQAGSTGGSLAIRCRGSVTQIERDVRQIVRSVAPGLQVSDVSTMELLRDNAIARDRLLALLSSLFGALGTALALAGIYGLISFSVTTRRREIGIRMSVGAQRGDVLMMFLREVAGLLGIGLLVGIPLALGFARLLPKLLYQVSPSDPAGIVATTAVLIAGGLTAAYIPSRRATRIDPVQALRCD